MEKRKTYSRNKLKLMNSLNLNWSRIFKFSGAGFIFTFTLATLVISAVLGGFVPRFISALSESYSVEQKYFESLRNILILFVCIYINRVLFQLSVNFYIKKLTAHIRTQCFSRWLNFHETISENNNKSLRDKFPQGEVASRIMSDTEALRELITSGTFGIIIDLFFVTSCFISFVGLNKTTGVSILIAEIVAGIILVYGSKYMRSIFLSVRKSRGHVFRELSNLIGGFKETYFNPHGDYASKKGDKVFHNFLYVQLKANVWDAGYYSLAESLYPLMLAFLVVVIPKNEVMQGALIFAIIDLIQRSVDPIKGISSKVANVQRALSGIERINEFLNNLGPEENGNTEFLNVETKPLKKYIINVDKFSYTKKSSFSLSNINIECAAKQLIGIVGSSGCGKSTLLNILAGNILPNKFDLKLLDVENESILSINENSPGMFEEYRTKVGLVSQESHVFSESIVFNITFSNDINVEFESFWAWAKTKISYLAIWDEFLDTKLDQHTLSLGQRQLIAALRACYLKKDIILFDEISSAMDGALEAALRQAILLTQQNSLTFIVAHRVETIVKADKIFVMKEGEVVAAGAHGQLLESSKEYKELINELSHSDLS